MEYNYAEIEKKWQKYWVEHKSGRAVTGSDKPKFYGLIEFPYPSGQGLHVGHTRPYHGDGCHLPQASGMQGYNVLFPIGYDAFGLPTENYAIKNHVHPAIVTKQNIANFRKTAPACLATRSTGTVTWIRPTRSITSGRSGSSCRCIKRVLRTRPPCRSTGAPAASACLRTRKLWTACASAAAARSSARRRASGCSRITKYADRLIDDLDDVDFIDRVKTQQRNWIGRSDGAEVTFSTTLGDYAHRVTPPAAIRSSARRIWSSLRSTRSSNTWKDKLTNCGRGCGLSAMRPPQKSDFERTRAQQGQDRRASSKAYAAINPVTRQGDPDLYLGLCPYDATAPAPSWRVPGARPRATGSLPRSSACRSSRSSQGGDVTKEAFTPRTTPAYMVNSGFLNGMTR